MYRFERVTQNIISKKGHASFGRLSLINSTKTPKNIFYTLRNDINLYPYRLTLSVLSEKLYFSTNSKKKNEEKPSLDDTINRLKSENSEENANEKSQESSSSNSNSQTNELLNKVKEQINSFQESVIDTWHELINSGKAKSIQERAHEASENRKKRDSYAGPTDLIIIDPNENLGAWEKMQRRLSEAPIIQSILGITNDIYEKSGAKRGAQKIKEIKSDAEEVWETSQNPWVYRVSSVYDTVTAESEFATATRLIRKLDPNFSMEMFLNDCVEETIPQIMKWILKGDINSLEPLLSESVYSRLNAEMTARKKEKLVLDPHLLGIFNAEIIAAEVDKSNDYGEKEPILLIHYMCQQINCVRDENGKVVEGKEDEIKANSYLVAFQREIDEIDGDLLWKIVDFRFNGAIAWI